MRGRQWWIFTPLHLSPSFIGVCAFEGLRRGRQWMRRLEQFNQSDRSYFSDLKDLTFNQFPLVTMTVMIIISGVMK